MTVLSFTVPIEAPSISNLREHWARRAKRVEAQRRATGRCWPGWSFGPLLVVRLTRVAPRRLDDDNLRGALKAVRDEVAKALKVDDASPLVRWDYAQEKGAASVRVEVLSPAEAREVEQAAPDFATLGEWMRDVNAPPRAARDIRTLATPNHTDNRRKP